MKITDILKKLPSWLLAATVALISALVFFADVLPLAKTFMSPDDMPLYPDGIRSEWFNGLLNASYGTVSHDTLLSFAMSPYNSHDLSYILSSVLLAIAVAVYLRRWRVSAAACAFGGVAMAFAGYHFTLFSAGHRGYFVMMPYAVFIFALIDRAVDSPRWYHFALMAVCVAYGMGYQPDVLVLFLALAAAYAAFRAIQAVRRLAGPELKRRAAKWAIGVCVAAATLGVAGYPAMRKTLVNSLATRQEQLSQAVGHGSTSAEAKAGEPVQKTVEETAAEKKAKWVFATNWSLPPEDVLEFFAPNVRGYYSGSPKGPYAGRLGRSYDYDETHQGFFNFRQHSMYIGGLQIMLALFAVFSAIRGLAARGECRGDAPAPGAENADSRKNCASARECRGENGVAVFWAIAGAIALLLAMGRYTAFYGVFYATPMGKLLRAPVKFVHILELCVAILSAFGLEKAMRIFQCERRGPRIVAAAFGGVCMLAATVFWAAGAGSPDAAMIAEMFPGQNFGEAVCGELAVIRGAALMHASLMLVIAGAVFILPIIIGKCNAVVPAMVSMLCVAAIAADLLTSAKPYLVELDVAPFMARNPLVEMLSRNSEPDGNAVACLVQQLPSTVPALFSVESGHYALAMPAANDGPDSMRWKAYAKLGGDMLKVMNFWGTRAILAQPKDASSMSKNGVGSIFGAFRLTQGGGLATVQSLDEADLAAVALRTWTMPAGLFTDWEEAESEDNAWRRMAEKGFDFSRKIVVENQGDALNGLKPAAGGVAAKGSVELKEVPSQNGGRRAVATVNADRPCMLFFRMHAFSGKEMRASVDGRPAPALRANAQYWAVPVGEGAHEVVLAQKLRYSRLAFHVAGVLVLLAALVCSLREKQGS